MVGYKALCRVLRALDGDRSTGQATGDAEEDTETEAIENDDVVARLPWKSGVEQIRDIVERAFGIPPLYEIIQKDQTLRGDRNHEERGPTLYLFLTTWGTDFPHLKIQKADLGKILRGGLGKKFTGLEFTGLEVCTDKGNAEDVIDRLVQWTVLERTSENMPKRHGVGVRSKESVFLSPNARLFDKFQGPTAAYRVMANLPAIVEIATTLQLDRDAALETLEYHGLLDEYEERRKLAESYRTLPVWRQGDDAGA